MSFAACYLYCVGVAWCSSFGFHVLLQVALSASPLPFVAWLALFSLLCMVAFGNVFHFRSRLRFTCFALRFVTSAFCCLNCNLRFNVVAVWILPFCCKIGYGYKKNGKLDNKMDLQIRIELWFWLIG